MQNLVYVILMTKRKLWHYFDTHPITVVSKYPLREVIQNAEAEGRIAKRALEMMGLNITYALLSAINSKYSRTLWPSGWRFKLPQRKSSTILGSCTLMARS
jgi:hypothetical protein